MFPKIVCFFAANNYNFSDSIWQLLFPRCTIREKLPRRSVLPISSFSLIWCSLDFSTPWTYLFYVAGHSSFKESQVCYWWLWWWYWCWGWWWWWRQEATFWFCLCILWWWWWNFVVCKIFLVSLSFNPIRRLIIKMIKGCHILVLFCR